MSFDAYCTVDGCISTNDTHATLQAYNPQDFLQDFIYHPDTGLAEAISGQCLTINETSNNK